MLPVLFELGSFSIVTFILIIIITLLGFYAVVVINASKNYKPELLKDNSNRLKLFMLDFKAINGSTEKDFEFRNNRVFFFNKEIINYALLLLLLELIVFIFGPIEIRSYGVLFAGGFSAGILYSMMRASKRGIKREFLLDVGVITIISAVIGAKLFYIIFYEWQYFFSNPVEILKSFTSGFVFFGGLIGAVTADIIYIRKKGYDVRQLGDIIAPGVMLGLAIGRIGCFGHGCCYGKLLKWGIKFPVNSPAFNDHLKNKIVELNAGCSLPVYPTQIMSSLGVLLIFFLALWIEKKKTLKTGQMSIFVVMAYSGFRFLIEYLRVNPVYFGLTISQWIALIIFVSSFYLIKLTMETEDTIKNG